jgi:carbon-monoxide dehydrogenase large subunit
VAPARITVVHGQTDRIGRGMGAFATRVTVMTGAAISVAAGKLRTQLLARAAELLQRPAEELELAEGAARAADGSGAAIALGDLVGEAGMIEEGTYESGHMTYPYGIHMAIARVDPATSGVTLERVMVGYDIGRAVNPMLVEGQITGGAAQGIGGALLEEFRYAEDGAPLSVTFADYMMPTSAEMPPVFVLVTEDAPSGVGTLGVKGAGEGGTTAMGAAIAAAVDAALSHRVPITRLPIVPAELHALRRAAAV